MVNRLTYSYANVHVQLFLCVLYTWTNENGGVFGKLIGEIWFSRIFNEICIKI